VLGNPPWEHTELKEQEWFATRDLDIANAAGVERKRKIDSLAKQNPDLHNAFLDARRQEDCSSYFIRNSERYPLCGRGRINTYAIFAETNRLILGLRGRVGCIVPSGIATDDTTKYFFRNLMDSHTLVSLYSFENEEFIFSAVHHATKFCLLTISGYDKSNDIADFVFFARQTPDLQDEEKRFSLSAKDIALLNPNTRTCPIFRSKRDLKLTKAIYSRIPVFVRDGSHIESPWGISFLQGVFNMTSDSHLFRTRKQLEAEGLILEGNIFHKDNEVYLPLYEGKMIWHFDHRFGTYEGQTQAQANQGKLPELNSQQHADPSLLSIPQYWIYESQMPKIIQDGTDALLVFRDITNASVLRTAIFSILPVVACGHTLPIVLFDNKSTR